LCIQPVGGLAAVVGEACPEHVATVLARDTPANEIGWDPELGPLTVGADDADVARHGPDGSFLTGFYSITKKGLRTTIHCTR
jgi:hypothetical protein